MTTVFAKLSQLRGLYQNVCILSAVKSRETLERHSQLAMFLLGLVLLYTGGSELAHAGQGSYAMACNRMLSLIEGTFGALVTAVAGVAAIVAAAMGGFKMAWSLIVVAVGSFILRSYVGLFNGGCDA